MNGYGRLFQFLDILEVPTAFFCFSSSSNKYRLVRFEAQRLFSYSTSFPTFGKRDNRYTNISGRFRADYRPSPLSSTMSTFEIVPDKVHFPENEEKILEIWTAGRFFQKSSELAEGRPLFSFYDGPPFATGLPHYGHILAGTIKVSI
ncbi:hypothetical protein IE077_000775, partial [Cardiosporidium cionae]